MDVCLEELPFLLDLEHGKMFVSFSSMNVDVSYF